MFIGSFGRDDYWCWVPAGNFHLNLSLLISFEFWFLLCLSYVSYWYIKSILFIKQLYGRNANMILIRKLILYPLVLFLNWIFLLLLRFSSFLSSSSLPSSSSFLLFLYVLFVSSEGILNSVIYGLKRNLRNSLQPAFSLQPPLLETEMQEPKGQELNTFN